MIRLIFLFLSLLCLKTSAQQTITQEMLWLRYYNTVQFNDKVSLHSEIESRFFLPTMRSHHLLLPRMGLNYQVSESLEANFGFNHFNLWLPQEPTPVAPTEHIQQFWLHQFIKTHYYFGNNGRFKLTQRYMLEERFFEKPSGSSKPFGVNFRLRLQTALMVMLADELGKNNNTMLSLVCHDELFVQAGEDVRANVFDHNRFFIGSYIKFGKRLGMETGYMHWYQQLPIGNKFFSRHLLRVTFFHNIFI
ncbi:MAG: DUF2490 domain-containing protein [Salibacteraceae bacterium]